MLLQRLAIMGATKVKHEPINLFVTVNFKYSVQGANLND